VYYIVITTTTTTPRGGDRAANGVEAMVVEVVDEEDLILYPLSMGIGGVRSDTDNHRLLLLLIITTTTTTTSSSRASGLESMVL